MERNEAAALGFATYNTGRACKWGHEPVRYTASGICVECARENNRKAVQRAAKRVAAARTNDQVVLTMRVHHLSYTGLYAQIQAVNALMGIRPEVNPADYVPSPIDGSLMRREDAEHLRRERDAAYTGASQLSVRK